MSLEKSTGIRVPVTYEPLGAYGVEIAQKMTPAYRDSIKAELPSPFVFDRYGLDEDTGMLWFRYPDAEGYSEVEINVIHKIIRHHLNLADGCCPETATPRHDYIFIARQLLNGTDVVDETREPSARTIGARFVHPVSIEPALNRPRIISRLVALTAGWAWPGETAHELTYSDGSCREYAPEYAPDFRLAVMAKSENAVTMCGYYTKQMMAALLSNWDEPDMACHTRSVLPTHDFHVQIQAWIPEAGLNMTSVADDLASIACDAWLQS